jgi:putative ABC transport system permease protein
MNIFELARLAWFEIRANRLRSVLTVLGVVIGVAAVIALLAVGQGAKDEEEKQMNSLGLNVLFIRAGETKNGTVSKGMGSASTLTVADADAIHKACPSVLTIAPGASIAQQVQFGSHNTKTTIEATVPEFFEIRNIHALAGRFFNATDVDHGQMICVIAPTVASLLFADQNPIGKKILINGEFFEIIGLAAPKGVVASQDMDDRIYVPLKTAYDRLFGLNGATGESVQFIDVQAKSLADILPAQYQITNLLRLRHRIRAPRRDDFYLRTEQELVEASGNVSEAMSVLLACMASISLIVGGIGVMNIMLVSVAERTKEIGIRKAVGARSMDIMWQFVVEAMVLTLTGGIVGVLFGLFGSYAIGHFTRCQTTVTAWSVCASCLVAITTGLFFGIYPARRASQLNPIDALRSE